MKKFGILMGALVLAMVAIVIIACTKEKETMVAQSSDEMVAISKEDDMSAYLKQFKEKMQSASKRDESLSLEDARWHLEALLNYTFGDAGHETTDIQSDTLNYRLPTEDGKVSLAHLNEAFNSLSFGVEKCLADCDLPDKSLLAIRTKFGNGTRDGVVNAQFIVDVRGYSSGNAMPHFGPTDYWSENDASGKCGPYEGECDGIGSVQALELKINANLPSFSCNQGRGYFSDYDSIPIDDSFIFDYLRDSLSPYGYRVHYHGCPTWQYPTCLSPDDLNYYLDEALKLINELKPVGKVIVRMTNEYYELVPVGYRFGYHHYTFIYAKFNCGGGNDY